MRHRRFPQQMTDAEIEEALALVEPLGADELELLLEQTWRLNPPIEERRDDAAI